MTQEPTTKEAKTIRVEAIRGLVQNLRSENAELGVDMTPDQIVDATMNKIAQPNGNEARRDDDAE